jgi:hypothetical protein
VSDLLAQAAPLPAHQLLFGAAGLVATLLLLALVWVTARPRYRRQDTLFTAAELSFYRVLDRAVGNDYRIFAKVRMADVVSPQRTVFRGLWWKAFTKVSSKHVDYLLVQSDTLAIVAAIELDDRSHAQKDRRERDRFVQKAFAQAGIPLLRIQARRDYNVGEVRKRIRKAIGRDHGGDSGAPD